MTGKCLWISAVRRMLSVGATLRPRAASNPDLCGVRGDALLTERNADIV